MIKVKRSLFAAAALGLALVGSSAQAAFSSFWFDPDGNSATNNSIFINGGDGLTLGGGSISVTDTFTGPNTFDFTQTGTITVFGPVSMVGTISVSGAGTGVQGGDLNYSSGSVLFKNLLGNVIATFGITGGGAQLTNGLTPGSNNTVSLTALLSSVTAGYFFQDVGGVQGTDFASFENGKPVFALSTTNFSNPVVTLIKDGEVTVGANITARAGGQLYLEVPEPESLALMGLGLVALVAARRRKTAK